jgi:DUF4097 and DUF4098 domain-containing protein YvlB
VGGFHDRFPIEGLRRIELRLSRGDIRLERISGDTIEIDSDDPIQADVIGTLLSIRPGNRVSPERPHVKTPFLGSEFGDLGASISEMVSNAVDSIMKAEIHLGNLGSADVRIGIPAILERPEIVASTGMGEIDVEGLAADCALQSSAGDITVGGSSGALQATTGRGELSIQGFDGPITARTGSGDATLSDCRGDGAVHTGSGDIECMKISGSWTLQSGAGDIQVRLNDQATLKISTGAGDINVYDGSLISLSVQSGSGDVECSSVLTGPRHQLVTGHGDIKIAIPDPPGARLQVLTRNGDVRSEYPLVAVGKQGRYSHGGGRYVGNIGDSSIDIELRTSSGDISIKRGRSSGTREQHEAGGPAASATSEAAAYAGAREQHEKDARAAAAMSEAAIRTTDPEGRRDTQGAMTEAQPPQTDARSFEVPPPPPAPVTPLTFGPASEGTQGNEPQPADRVDGGAVQVEAASGTGNPRLAVLENLQYGKITVAEAAQLLDAIDRS